MVRPLRLCSLLFVSALGFTSLACGTRVKVETVSNGPGGGDWKAISCSRMNEKCFKVAQHMCPNGYVFARAGEKSPDGESKVTTLPPQEEWNGEMYSKKPGKLLVRCSTSAPKLSAQN